MKSKENWVVSVGVLFVVSLVYALLNSLKSINSASFMTLFFSNLVWVFGMSVLLYVALSFTKLNLFVRIVIVGVFTPVILNLFNALFYHINLGNVYPIALFDSVIVLFLLAGGFYLADKFWGKRK
jgi:hypothetical protein